jgi:membrane-associated progesterone receptor component
LVVTNFEPRALSHRPLAAHVPHPVAMGIVTFLDTVLTFTFMIPATLIAVAMIAGLDFLKKQEMAEKQISPVAASPGMELSLAELSGYDGTTNGKPILVSVMGKVYDVGGGAGLYGPSGQYHAFAGKDITVACGKFNKSTTSLLNAKWSSLTQDERSLVTKFEDVFHAKYPIVGAVTDLQNLFAASASEGVQVQADQFSVKLGAELFAKGHIVAA